MDDKTCNDGESASKLTIKSFNVNDLGNVRKRNEIFKFLEKKDGDIYVLIDTRFSQRLENRVKAEWGSQVFFSSFSSQARGVAIFFKKGTSVEVLKQKSDNKGNLLSLLLKYDDEQFLLTGLYGPNEDDLQFYRNEVFELINEWSPNYTVYTGDWNLVMNQNKDTKNYLHENNIIAKNEVKNKMEEFSLIDVWRDLNPDSARYTWIGKGTNPKKFARLDFFLISNTLLPFIAKAIIEPGILSDHSMTSIEIDFRKFKRGRGFWKFNNSLLRDMEYVKIVKKCVKKVVKTYADEQFTEDFIENASPSQLQALTFNINPQLLFDMIQLEIRGETIKYSSRIKKETNGKTRLLLHQLEQLEAVSASDDPQTFQLYQNSKSELEKIFKLEAEGAAVRARAKYAMDGERPTRLFCSLERYQGTQKFIPQLIKEVDGREILITEQSEIEPEIRDYYLNLFDCHDHVINIESVTEYLGPTAESFPKLTNQEAASVEGILTLEEMSAFLKKTRNNVSPGSSGFTGDFYKFFWIDLKHFVVRSANYSFEVGSLSIQQRLGIITLLPKGLKDKRFLKNWRPLTLLNTFFKLISGCISERVKPFLNKLIHPDQKGFVSERYIGDAIRSCYDTMEYAKNNNKTGLLLAIDFEKAFDSISFSFIEKSLKFYNFPADLIKWISLMLNNFQASVNHCGNISERFNIGRGCRQGDPLAPYLFIMAIEFLAHRLREDQGVKGFAFKENIMHTLDIYADDMTVYIHPSSENLRNVLRVIKEFYHLSGLKVSVSKTKAVWFGNKANSDEILCPEENLVWAKNFTLLGIDFTADLKNMEQNYFAKIEDLQKTLNSWRYRHLTPYGKIVVIKSLALSKLSHIAMVVPDLSKTELKKLEKICFDFLWSNKPAKVCKVDAILPEKRGGLGMVDIESFWKSFKCSWLRRILNSNDFWPKILEIELKKLNCNIKDIFFSGPSKLLELSKNIGNKFWANVILHAASLTKEASYSIPESFYLFPIWNNPMFKNGRRVFHNPNMNQQNHKIMIVADLFSSPNVRMTPMELNTKYNANISPVMLNKIHQAIITAANDLNFNLGQAEWHCEPRQSVIITIAQKQVSGCRSFYNVFRARACERGGTTRSEEKWHEQLDTVLSIDYWNSAIRLNSSHKNDNFAKWLEYQILRNSIFTNDRVSRFKPNVSDKCDLCGLETENSYHLFYQCFVSQRFWVEIKQYLLIKFNLYLPVERLSILFGIVNQAYSSVLNTIIILGKQLIWSCKHGNKLPTLSHFKNSLAENLKTVKMCFMLKNQEPIFDDQWGNIYHDLLTQQDGHRPQLHDAQGQ